MDSSSSEAAEFKFRNRGDDEPSFTLTLASDSSADSPVHEKPGTLEKKWKKHKKEKHHHHKSRDKKEKHHHKSHDKSKELPYLKIATREYGEPSILYVSKSDPNGSFAHWSEQALKEAGHPELRRVEIRARGYTHDFPRPHGDYVYTTVVYEIPPKKIWDVLKLSDSLSYDRLSHEVTSRCAGWRTNSAILYLACRLADGFISLEDAEERDVLEKMMTKAARDEKVARKYSKKLAAMITAK